MTFETDGEALVFLSLQGWEVTRIVSVLLSPRKWVEMCPEERAAVQYLCDEWDYTWDEMQKF